MVRPVEPEPPDALRKINPRVKRTEASPDKLGYQHVGEQQRRHRDHHQNPNEQGQPLDADEVDIHQDETEAQAAERTEAERKSDDTGPTHIDVAG